MNRRGLIVDDRHQMMDSGGTEAAALRKAARGARREGAGDLRHAPTVAAEDE